MFNLLLQIISYLSKVVKPQHKMQNNIKMKKKSVKNVNALNNNEIFHFIRLLRRISNKSTIFSPTLFAK